MAKKNSLLSQAQQLGASKYAPVLREIELNRNTNTSLYTSAGNQRRTAADKEIGSIAAAGATAQRLIGDLGTSNATMYQKAIANSQTSNQALLDKVNANNTGMLSSLQASMKARGVENVGDYSNLQGEMAKKNELFAALGSIQTNSLTEQSGLANQRFGALQAGSAQLDTTAKSQARGAAQANFDELYSRWLARQQELETANERTKLEKEDYVNQTYLTLKERAAQARAEAAALQMEYAYKGAALSETQRHNLTTEGISAGNSSLSAARFGLDTAKFDWQKVMDKANLAAKGSKAPKTPKGFNDANSYMASALKLGGFNKTQQSKLLSNIKNTVPTMNNGQSYSRLTQGYGELLTGGGAAADLDNYINRVLSASGVPNSPANKAMLQSMLNQYGLIAKKEA